MIKKEALEEEILREISAVGGHYGARLEESLNELKRVRRALEYLKERVKRPSNGVPAWSAKRASALRKLEEKARKRAETYKYYLIVYREALGLTSHRILYEVYELELLERG
ncbi:MAG: hypothetical protein GXO03_04315 [Aquificae bacterium]|nr:hypothetical protein [Aquificota bacterium]